MDPTLKKIIAVIIVLNIWTIILTMLLASFGAMFAADSGMFMRIAGGIGSAVLIWVVWYSTRKIWGWAMAM